MTLQTNRIIRVVIFHYRESTLIDICLLAFFMPYTHARAHTHTHTHRERERERDGNFVLLHQQLIFENVI